MNQRNNNEEMLWQSIDAYMGELKELVQYAVRNNIRDRFDILEYVMACLAWVFREEQ